MAIFKNAQWDLFIDTDNFPIITTNSDNLVCPLCRTMLCCNKEVCNCWYEKATLQDAYIYQKKEIKEVQRAKMLKVRQEKWEGFDEEWRIMIYQADMCPNNKCWNHAYYCRNWCVTDPTFDMSKYVVVNKQF